MFTGIISATGQVVAVKNTRRGRFIAVKAASKIVRKVPEGGSVSVEGVCLTRLSFCHPERSEGSRAHARDRTFVRDSSPPTADQNDKSLLCFELMDSTLKRTTLGTRKVGDRVNVESAMLVGQPIGGHFISGHVDGVGRVSKVTRERHPERSPKGVVEGSRGSGSAYYMVISVPRELHRYLVPQGSVVVNGVSLTVVEVRPPLNLPLGKGEKEGVGNFSVALTKYTLTHTNLGDLRVGDKVNIEVDMLAKYLEKFLNMSSRGRRPWRSP